MAPLTLTNQHVVQLYCLARQAERSIDAALFAPWSDLEGYYKGERISGLQQVLDSLHTLLEQETVPALSREEMIRNITEPGTIRYLFGPWLARWKKRWTFWPQELSFLAATLQRFICLLQSGQESARETMVSLRMDFWACEYLIKCRCHGLAELPRATHLEHFNQSAHVASVTIRQLVSSPANLAAVGSRPEGLAVQRDSHQ